MSLRGFTQRFQDLQRRLEILPRAIGDIVAEEQRTLLQLNKDTMILGRDNRDQPLYPSYLDHPYWSRFRHPRQAATAYRNYKVLTRAHTRSLIQYLFDEPEKSMDTPDLFIDGSRTYDPMRINIKGAGFEIVNNDTKAQRVYGEHGGRILGLSPIAIKYFRENFLVRRLRKFLLTGRS